jgi:hypothetical protein
MPEIDYKKYLDDYIMIDKILNKSPYTKDNLYIAEQL